MSSRFEPTYRYPHAAAVGGRPYNPHTRHIASLVDTGVECYYPAGNAPRIYPVTQALTTTLRVIAKDVFVAATADRGQFVEARFLREIEQSGFIASLYGTEVQ
jgi:hypothetical protein